MILNRIAAPNPTQLSKPGKYKMEIRNRDWSAMGYYGVGEGQLYYIVLHFTRWTFYTM